METPRLLWTDRPIQTRSEDCLNFSDYADILADIILTADTPITLGIFGPWGSGKTSLMRLIAERLTGQRTPGHRRARVVWFNAWQYERDEATLWRSLFLHILDGLRGNEFSEADARQIEDWRMRLYTDVERTEWGSLQVDWPAAGKAALKLGLSFIPGPSTLVELAKLAQGNLSVAEELVRAFRRERVEIHRRRLSFLEEFQAGFAHLVRQYIWSRNCLLVLFVDDLDRCLPARAVEILEAIKLYLDVPGCVFVIAADREVIERVVQSQYGAEGDTLIQGRDYLDKLVQIPFYLPPLEEERILAYIADHAPEVDEVCRTIFATGLEPNPRVVKRALNVFRLLSDLARRRGQAGVMEPVEPGLLAKMVVVQTRYCDLYRDLQEYPLLIQDLEAAAREGTEVHHPVASASTETGTLLEKYLRYRSLLRMLPIGPAFTSLSRGQIAAYIYLVRTAGAERMELPADLPARRWADLVSNDPTRLRSAVEAIREQGTIQWYVDSLVRVLERDSGASVTARLSAATALGYLGDPRNLDEMVDVSGGPFLRQEERRSVMTMAFRIGRYPVTNARYARFLAANPWYPVPYVDEEWARPYNWDPVTRTYQEGKANHPVVLVSWEDAMAYCAWAGVRLPTEEEWEKAARGEDGRVYPWGPSFDPARANVRESGIGSTTPVGIYPDGASPYGLMDCAGNVWEWTATPHDEEEFIIKGGAWSFYAEDARTFTRERARRGHRSHCVGFRVAASPTGVRPDADRSKEKTPKTGRPVHFPEHGALCLVALADAGLGRKISLGGAAGLLHYLDYRPTRDVDAWWETSTSAEDRRRVISVLEAALRPYGEVRIRTWGDVVSLELLQEGRGVFAFQIADRMARLEMPRPAPWVDVLLDSLPDLLASKMVALVERGAPRDFRDVYTMCDAGLTTPEECWALWRRKQELSHSDADPHRARLAVETHLARIAQHRPLEQIVDPNERASTAHRRAWFATEFLDALGKVA